MFEDQAGQISPKATDQQIKELMDRAAEYGLVLTGPHGLFVIVLARCAVPGMGTGTEPWRNQHRSVKARRSKTLAERLPLSSRIWPF